MKFLPSERHKIVLGPSTHIAYFPYEMASPKLNVHGPLERAFYATTSHTQPIIHPSSGSNIHTLPVNGEETPQRSGKVRSLLKNTLVEHLYTLFAAPIE